MEIVQAERLESLQSLIKRQRPFVNLEIWPRTDRPWQTEPSRWSCGSLSIDEVYFWPWVWLEKSVQTQICETNAKGIDWDRWLTQDVTIKDYKGRGIYDPFFKLSLKPRAKEWNGSKNHPKGLGASVSGGTYDSVLGRTVGLLVSSTVASGSSRLRLRLCEVPEGIDSGAMRVFSVEAGEGGVRENWRGKVIELTLSLLAIGTDLQDNQLQLVCRVLRTAHLVHCDLCSSQLVRLKSPSPWSATFTPQNVHSILRASNDLAWGSLTTSSFLLAAATRLLGLSNNEQITRTQ